MKTADFDERFDEGKEDILANLDLSKMKRPSHQQRPVSVNLPVWMIEAIDREASRLGVTRQSIIKVWIAERLEHASSR